MTKASEILPRLYQGGFPPSGDYLSKQGIRVLALCARELQPPDTDYPGVQVLRCPLNDQYEPLTPDERVMAQRIALKLAHAVRGGRKVLITCAMGINRSGLIMALTIRELTGMAGIDAVRLIRRKRSGALTNESFVRALEALPGKTVEPMEFQERRKKGQIIL
jgi:protein-tyrosine phosphatase